MRSKPVDGPLKRRAGAAAKVDDGQDALRWQRSRPRHDQRDALSVERGLVVATAGSQPVSLESDDRTAHAASPLTGRAQPGAPGVARTARRSGSSRAAWWRARGPGRRDAGARRDPGRAV